MIENCLITPPVTIEWVSDSAIVGLRISVVDAKFIIFMEKRAGIKKCILIVY